MPVKARGARDLDRAIALVGLEKLAKAFKLKPATILGWRRRGVPQERLKSLEEKTLAAHWEEVMPRELEARRLGRPVPIPSGAPKTGKAPTFQDLKRFRARHPSAAAAARELGLPPTTVREAIARKRLTPKLKEALWRERALRLEKALDKRRAEKRLYELLDLAKSEYGDLASELRGLEQDRIRIRKGITSLKREIRFARRVQDWAGVQILEATLRRGYEDLSKIALEIEKRRSRIRFFPSRERTHKGPRSGPLTIGYEWRKSWKLTIDTNRDIEKVKNWFLEPRKGSYEWWQAGIAVALFDVSGEAEKLYGYRSGVVLMHTPRGREYFITERYFSPKRRSLKQAVEAVLEQLRQASQSFLVFVTSTTIFNYRHRTTKETKTWLWYQEHQGRKKRAKQKQKKSKQKKSKQRSVKTN